MDNDNLLNERIFTLAELGLIMRQLNVRADSVVDAVTALSLAGSMELDCDSIGTTKEEFWSQFRKAYDKFSSGGGRYQYYTDKKEHENIVGTADYVDGELVYMCIREDGAVDEFSTMDKLQSYISDNFIGQRTWVGDHELLIADDCLFWDHLDDYDYYEYEKHDIKISALSTPSR